MSVCNQKSQRRRRKPTVTYHATSHSKAEELFLQAAIANSRMETFRPSDGNLTIPVGPTFYPTEIEFEGNPLHYINKIRPIAEKYGICKIVPPSGWDPPFSVDMDSKKKFQTKEQLLHRLQEGISFGSGKDYSASDYLKMAQGQTWKYRDNKYPVRKRLDTENALVDVPSSTQSDCSLGTYYDDKRMTPENLENDYWDIVETHSESVAVEYGNDVDTHEFGSGFPRSERGRCVNGKIDADKEFLPEPKFGTEDFYKETYWNLNNIPCCPDSILRHVKVRINGINVPWMYFGCLFSTFCWHNEDNYLYSINYHHWGAPKQWYGVPGTKKDAEGLERVFKNYLSMKMRDVPDLLHHITTMFSPRLLQQGGVPVYKLLQHQGEFVVTFPRAFHGGFSMGPNVGEAVNFATHDWIAHGSDANERYRSFARSAVFSHDRLTFTMANHLNEQKAYATCKLLVAELRRVIEEEMRLRSKLFDSGVRDLSGYINLPKNRLDQLDEESADYDDKRLCHACKHVCFFSCVACECSQSKVSCLRHSHYMCRCPTERKYMMIWSSRDDMKLTLENAERFSHALKTSEGEAGEVTLSEEDKTKLEQLPDIAPGAIRDWERHKGYVIDEGPFSPLRLQPTQGVSALRCNGEGDMLMHAKPQESDQDLKRIKLEASKTSTLFSADPKTDYLCRESDTTRTSNVDDVFSEGDCFLR